MVKQEKFEDRGGEYKIPPFTFSIGLNRDHPMVKAVLKEEELRQVEAGTEILNDLMRTTPSLKAKAEEFRRWAQRKSQPPHDRIE